MSIKPLNEVLVVLLLALTLAGLAAPAVRNVRAAAARTRSVDNLKLVGLAMYSWHDTFGRFPPAYDKSAPSIHHPVSIHVHLLPHVDQKAVFETFLTDGEGTLDAVVPAFVLPSDASNEDLVGVQNIAANLRVFSEKGWGTKSFENMPQLGAIEPGGRRSTAHTNGSSNVIGFATKLGQCGDGGSRYSANPTSPFAAFFGQNAARTTAQYSNPNATFQWAPRGDECICRPLMAQTYPPEAILTCWMDGTVRAFPGDTDPGVWNARLKPTVDSPEPMP